MRSSITIAVQKVLLHLLFWVMIVTYFAWGFGFNLDYKVSFLNSLLYLPGHMFVTYVLLYLLVPKFLLKKKYLAFFSGLFITVGCCTVYAWAVQLSLSARSDAGELNMRTGRAILPFFHVAGIAVSIKLLSHWYNQRQQTLEAEQQRTSAELQLLKSQLHPHFLFNTLNNLYSYTLEGSPRASEMVLKLSALLRFMIYENAEMIDLEKEISLMENYIALERMRYGDRLDVSVVTEIDKVGYQIAPLLLLPFLENAFKHGTSKQIDQCWISLHVSVRAGKMTFKLVNSIDAEDSASEQAVGGLGLKNVQRRLELLYKGRYTFATLMKEEVFVVNLELELTDESAASKPLLKVAAL